MASTYISHQIVHVHLPAAPSIPHAIPILRVPSSGPFLDDQDLSEPLHPDHASWTSYSSQLNLMTWTIHNGYTLELRPLDLYYPSGQTSNTPGTTTLRISFPHPLRPLLQDSLVLSKEDRCVYILVVTHADCLYRLSFPLGDFEPGQGNRFFFTTQGGDEWCEQYLVPEDLLIASGGVGPVAVVDPETVVLGCVDGGLIRLDRSGSRHAADWTATQHRVSSRFRIPSLFSSTSSDDEILSFEMFTDIDGRTVLYALSRDRKLRLWEAFSGQLLKTIDIRAASGVNKELVAWGSNAPSISSSNRSTMETSDGQLVRIVPTHSHLAKFSNLVVVFLSTPHSSNAAGSFAIYGVARGSDNLVHIGERTASRSSVGAELRAFHLSASSVASNHYILWAVWSQGGISFTESLTLDDVISKDGASSSSSLLNDWQKASQNTETDQLDAPYFDNLLPLDAPDPTNSSEHPDIPEVFIEHLFAPGRFSQCTLQTALDEYIASVPEGLEFPQPVTSYTTLPQKFKAIVGFHIPFEHNPQTGAIEVEAFRRELKVEWLGIWARVRELDRQARWPIGTVKVGDQLLIACREGFSAPIPEETSSLLDRLSSFPDGLEDFQDLPEEALDPLHPALASWDSRPAILAIAAAGQQLSSILSRQESDESGETGLEGITEALNQVTSKAADQAVEITLGGLWDDFLDPILTEEQRTSTRRLLSDCPDIKAGVTSTLDILCDFDLPLLTTDHPDLRFAGLGNALITATVSAMVHSAYNVARNVILVGLFVLAESDPSRDTEDGEELIQILSKAAVIYHRYRVLDWLCLQTGEESRPPDTSGSGRRRKRRLNGSDSLADGFGGLKAIETDAGSSDGFDPKYSLLDCLISRELRPRAETGGAGPIFSASIKWLSSLDLLKGDEADLEPKSADIQLAYTMLLDGHRQTGEFADLYQMSAGIAYIRGRAYLEMEGNLVEGSKLLQRAAAGCEGPSLSRILPPSGNDEPLVAYYRHIAQLFKDRGSDECVVLFGNLALAHTAPDDPNIREIRNPVFMAELDLGKYEDAYATMTSLTSLDLRKEYLSHLIASMCEANEVGRLNSLGFVGFQKDVENILEFKARHSDPFRFPNYYKVLYSWHIARGDYRSAGQTMYGQARRLGGSLGKAQASLLELVTMQARSYLAAINCLSLVDKRNAWVSIPAARDPSWRKRKRTTTFIPEEEFTQGNQAVAIVALADIQAEYCTVLSRLQLANTPQASEGDDHITMSPRELVGLFVQRGMFDLAQSAAQSLDIDMTDLFISLARRCVYLSRSSDPLTVLDPTSAAYIYSSPITNRLQGPPPARAMRYLQVTLARHDSAKTQWRYRAAVADTLFEMNMNKKGGFKMPQWLVEWEMERDPEVWISRALKWGWVEEAIDWVSDLLRKATPPELLPPKKSNITYTPFNLIDRVIAAAQETQEKDEPGVQVKVKALQDMMAQRIEGLKKVKT